MYEYAIQELSDASAPELLAWLNSIGEAAWEVFTVEPLPAGGYRLWLRRPRSNVMGGLERAQEDLPPFPPRS